MLPSPVRNGIPDPRSRIQHGGVPRTDAGPRENLGNKSREEIVSLVSKTADSRVKEDDALRASSGTSYPRSSPSAYFEAATMRAPDR